MMRHRFLWYIIASFLLVALGCAIRSSTQELNVRLIPMRDFFRNPEKTQFSLSPNGAYIAFLMPWQRRLNVHVQKCTNCEVTRITEATMRDIAAYARANNNRIVYVQDRGGDENYRLYAVDIDGSNPKELTPFEEVKVGIIDPLEDVADEMLISMNRRDPRVFDVYRINITSGTMKMSAQNPGTISGWVTDNKGELRVAVSTDGVNTSMLYRKTEGEAFKPVVTKNFKDSLNPLFFTFDNRYLYVASNIGRDKQALFKYDPERGEHLELIYEHPEVDVHTLLRSKKRKVVTGVSFITDKHAYYFFDEERRELQEILEKKLPGYEVVVTSMSKDETKVMARTYSDRSLGAYYYYDRASAENAMFREPPPLSFETESSPGPYGPVLAAPGAKRWP